MALGHAAEAKPAEDESQAAAPIEFHSYQEAMTLGKEKHQPVVLYFTADWCGWCARLHEDTFTDPAFRKVAANFIWGEIDIDEQKKIASQYNAHTIPRLVFFDSHGKQLGAQTGYLPPKPMIDVVQKYLPDKQADKQANAGEANDQQPTAKAPPDYHPDPAQVAATLQAVAKLSTSEGEQRDTARAALLQKGKQVWPGLVASLTDKRLAVRAAGYDLLVEATGQHLPFSAFADQATRAEQAAAWRQWVAARLPRQPAEEAASAPTSQPATPAEHTPENTPEYTPAEHTPADGADHHAPGAPGS